MFKGLYKLSKNGSLQQMKDFVERSTNGSVIDVNEDVESSISIQNKNNLDIDVASKVLVGVEAEPQKTLGKRSRIARTPNGSNFELKVKRK